MSHWKDDVVKKSSFIGWVHTENNPEYRRILATAAPIFIGCKLKLAVASARLDLLLSTVQFWKVADWDFPDE